jgi:hypothetical protein
MSSADWNKPALGDTYANFLAYLIARDFDAISLCYGGFPTNPQTGMLAYIRASDKFQEYNGSAWVDKVLSLAGGGTGGASAVGARASLGLGTMAIQNATGVTITGGSITGLGTFTTSGAITIGAGITAGSGAVGIVDSTGKIPALSSTYLASLSGANLTNLNGTNISSGTVAPARLGSGSPSSSNFLRGDGTWAGAGMRNVQPISSDVTVTGNGQDIDIAIGITLTDYTKAWFNVQFPLANSVERYDTYLTSNTNLRVHVVNATGTPYTLRVRGVVVESY